MIKRNTQERRQAIAEQVTLHGELSVEQLANSFSISEVTIRKDLTELEKNGLIIRRHGGAASVPNTTTNVVGSTLSANKIAIAKFAGSLIKDHSRIIIDSGSTTQALLPGLNEKKGLVVMTNALSIANKICSLENTPTLLMTGGTWDPRTESFQGQLAEQTLRAYDFDQLYIGADGIDPSTGTKTYSELLGVSQVMAEVAREVIVLVESSKIDRKIHNLELPWSSVTTLVTDKDLDINNKKIIESQGVTVVSAP